MIKTILDAKFKLAVVAALASIIGLLAMMAHKQVDAQPTPPLVHHQPTQQEAHAYAMKPFNLQKLP
jgi:hypothetical protein